MDTYKELGPTKVLATIEKLHRRIRDRFPEAGLSRKIWQKITGLQSF